MTRSPTGPDPSAPDASAPDAEDLLEHSDWVRSLAHWLVNDPDEADDLVQEAWVAALSNPPRSESSSRSWLARVLRNAAYASFRGRRRRAERERAVARSEELPCGSESIEQLETIRLLVDLVLGLDEPSRQVIVMRYFEGLPPREIAARLEEKPGTIRMRIKRALDTLRAELERRNAGERHWSVVLAPFAKAAAVVVLAGGALAGGWIAHGLATAPAPDGATASVATDTAVETTVDTAAEARDPTAECLEKRVRALEIELESSRELIGRQTKRLDELESRVARGAGAGAEIRIAAFGHAVDPGSA